MKRVVRLKWEFISLRSSYTSSRMDINNYFYLLYVNLRLILHPIEILISLLLKKLSTKNLF